MGVGYQRQAPAALPFVQEAGWAPGQVCSDAEKSRPQRDLIRETSSSWQLAFIVLRG